MRTYGRVKVGDALEWREVTTDANGFNDQVYLTTLAQVLLLNRGESPFYSDYGIPAQQSVIQQVFPDYYVTLTQQQFAGFFAALTVSKVNDPTPHYQINVTTHAGVKLDPKVPIPI